MSEEAIRIECPGCHRKFRLRARGPSGRNAVKCPKCGTTIPLEKRAAPQPEATKPSHKTDADLRKMLLRAKKKRTTDLTQAPSDATVPDLPTSPDDTAPDHGTTMPMGRSAMRANQLGTDQAGVAALRRKRRDTPRAGSLAAPALKPPTPPASIERPVVDEPTYTGPMPGRTPHITPSGSDLSRFLEPGNYIVRVEEVVYAPVTEKALAKLLNVGVFFAIDELCPEGGEWIPISSPELFSDLKARLAHRAHHMLARVAPGKPASSYGRPAKEEPAPVQEEATAPSQVALQREAEIPVEPAAPVARAEPEAAPETAAPKRRLWPWLVAFPLVFVGVTAALLAFAPDLSDQAKGMLATDEAQSPVEDAGVALSVLSEEDAGQIDPEPAFQSATAAVLSSIAVANSIDGQLRAAEELGEEEAATALKFAKWQRDPVHGDARKLLARLRQANRLSEARKVANWILATDETAPKELREFVVTSLRDEIAAQVPIEVTTDRFARIVRVDTGHRPAIVVQDVHGTQWTIWPDMGPDDWKNDIAVYRLCELMVCQFDVPKTSVMEIDKATFKALAKAGDANAKEMANRLRPDFDWSKKGVLRGSIRQVPTGVAWPVELSQIWRPWLTAGSGLGQLDDDVEQAHQTIAFFNAERVYPEVRGMKGRDLARQVSALLLVDYLVNNWNRFAPTEENWGTRTRINAGLVQSVEDSAAFLGDDSVRVNGRFSWSKRFSRATIDSLRGLKSDPTDDLLFPNPTKDDKDKLENLWAQRSRALRRINKLVKRYGAEDVFALDVDQKKDPK